MRAILYFLLIVLLLGITAAFAALNDGIISINYFIGESDIPLTYLLLACFFIGGLMSLLLIAGNYFKLRLELRKLRSVTNLKSKELSNLRELPVKDHY